MSGWKRTVDEDAGYLVSGDPARLTPDESMLSTARASLTESTLPGETILDMVPRSWLMRHGWTGLAGRIAEVANDHELSTVGVLSSLGERRWSSSGARHILIAYRAPSAPDPWSDTWTEVDR